MKKSLNKALIGIDEVGRGPLAGPVAVCAVYVENLKIITRIIVEAKKAGLPKLKDSKKLTEKGREQWAALLKNFTKQKSSKTQQKGETPQIHFALAYASPKQIDRQGIAVCIRSLLEKNLAQLQKNAKAHPSKTKVLLDGGLKAPMKYSDQQTIIKGDEKEPIIAFASIIAKVARDAYMKKLSKRYPEYKFDIHKGYGTLVHRTAIKKHGPTAQHRKTFIRNIMNVS